MRKQIIYFSLIILPLFLFIAGYILKTTHEFYYLWWFDQSYAYLINSLNITQLKEVGGVAHPGTPLQIFGAVILKIIHFTSGFKSDIVKEVYSNSEFYLHIIHTVLIFINSFTLFIIGLITYRITNNILESYFIQLSTFTAFFIYYGLLIVSSEQFLILFSQLIIGLSIFYLFNYKSTMENRWKLTVISSIICGIGLASKLNFFPLLFIPLIIINGFRYKLFFCLFVTIIFTIFMIPLFSQFYNLLIWAKALFIYNNQYAYAQPVASNLHTLSNNIIIIFSEDWYFALAYAITLITVIITYLNKSSSRNPLFNKAKMLLTGIFICFSIQIIIVAQHYAQYFMIPSLVLTNFSLLTCIMILSIIFRVNNIRYTNIIYITLILLNIVYGIFIYNNWIEVIEWNINEAKRAENYINLYHSNDLVIPSINSSNLSSVLEYSTHCSGRQREYYISVLNNLISDKIFYDPMKKKINFICKKEELDRIICNNNKIIFQVQGDGFLNNFLNELNKLCKINVVNSKLIFKNEIEEFVFEISYTCQNTN